MEPKAQENTYLQTLDPLRNDEGHHGQETVRVGESTRASLSMVNDEGNTKDEKQMKVMSEMRKHLIKMNREKMIERGKISANELAILGKYSRHCGGLCF